MKSVTLFLLLLAGCQVQAQNKPATVDGETNHVRVFAWKFWNGNDRNVATIPDTSRAMITVSHKIRYNKTFRFPGYIVHNGGRRTIFDECWHKLPETWAVKKIEKQLNQQICN
ncbi:hypothetical protein [Flavihumibacter petaseus]|uniref:Uncharacterized protein n=1 Tax=Flavihumibacter petaseus NBRC 106054 TaxID=1220578 RepID=A0A0E9N282_9BACT|nr:hypothetical protein [Flavihumibacter petaseus]GAO43776.1 hypothetical protein FPE01S_02_08820 [Flavihumibacter petaseus NBRC 106054]